MNSQMVLFAKNMILFLLIFFAIDSLFGIVFDKIFFVQKRKLTYAIEQSNESLLILGSSRAQHHYNSQILADSLGLSVYNAGVSGQNIYFHYALLKSVLYRYKPQIVLLEVFDIDIYKTPSGWNTDKLSALYPYYYRDTAVKEIVDLRSPFEPYILTSNFVRYNSQIPYPLSLALFYKNTEISYTNMGYMPIDVEKHLTGELANIVEEKYGGVIDYNKIYYLRKFAQLCRLNGIRCIFAISPIFENISTMKYLSIIKNVANECGIEFYDFSNESVLMNPEYFKDIVHINDNGVDLYTSKIACKIMRYK